MEPTLVDGQIVWVNYWFRPKAGDVVAATVEEKTIVKRIKKIEKEKFWLEGDNPEDSYDSRKFGSVTLDKIVGKVII